FPTSGNTGSTVVLTGTNFTGATAVLINGLPVGSFFSSGFTVNSPTQITVNSVPSAATTGPVTVITPGGTASSSGNFTVNTLGAGAPGAAVTITGANLTSSESVFFNGVPASLVSFFSSTAASYRVPVGATTGPITVVTSAGTATTSTDFTVTAGVAPTV